MLAGRHTEAGESPGLFVSWRRMTVCAGCAPEARRKGFTAHVEAPREEVAMTDWNPTLYRQFEDKRTRPAREPLARVPLNAAANVHDLGCGPGNSTALLVAVARFVEAAVPGVDNSPAMLADMAAWGPGGAATATDLRQRFAAVGARAHGDPAAPVHRGAARILISKPCPT
jgi:SAM-dependent methyltransferase